MRARKGGLAFKFLLLVTPKRECCVSVAPFFVCGREFRFKLAHVPFGLLQIRLYSMQFLFYFKLNYIHRVQFSSVQGTGPTCESTHAYIGNSSQAKGYGFNTAWEVTLDTGH